MITFARASLKEAFTLSLVDGRGNLRYLTAGWRDLLGYGPEQVTGRDWFSFLHADDVAEVREQFRAFVEAGVERGRWILRFRAADGGARPLEVRARNLLSDPEVGGVLLSLRPMPSA